ncbi:MAG: dUTP diphosphatase [Leptospiraceae bacterium]|nr:dUTP diphosphatase [Leptospiraceae bacterium]MCK6379763.1 dUTP diphosphatase [Leptospiraceae bacterium]
MSVKIRKLHEDSCIPKKQTEFSAGYDLHAYCKEYPIIIPPGKLGLVPSGVSMEIPVGYDLEIRPRSGISTKFLVIIPNSPGTIDSDYRGEIFVPMLNLSEKDFEIQHGMRIAQGVIRKTYNISWDIVQELDLSSNRGTGGFGSTGV